MVYDQKNNVIAKVGISGGPVRADGVSYRPLRQITQWTKKQLIGDAGQMLVLMVYGVASGEGARTDILNWEERAAEELRKINGENLKRKKFHQCP
jgi:hypothetical protein